jgi:hypothetical protein
MDVMLEARDMRCSTKKRAKIDREDVACSDKSDGCDLTMRSVVGDVPVLSAMFPPFAVVTHHCAGDATLCDHFGASVVTTSA